MKLLPSRWRSGQGLCHAQAGASFSLLTIGNLSGQPVSRWFRVPHLLSLIAGMSWNGKVAGIARLQNAVARRRLASCRTGK